MSYHVVKQIFMTKKSIVFYLLPVVGAVSREVGVEGTQQSSDGWIWCAQGVSDQKKV